MIKTYKFKLRPSRHVENVLEQTLDVCRELYNAGLQERRDAYRLNRVSVNYYAQSIQLPDIRQVRDDVEGVYAQVLQNTLRRLNRTFEEFFRRVKSREKPGYPRFKRADRYSSFTYPQKGFWLSGDKLRLSKIGSCRLRVSRPIEGKIKTCTIKREVDGWYVIFAVEANQCRYFPKTGDTCGVDVGIENFATFSTGEIIENPRFLRLGERGLKIQQRRISKKKRGGSNRRKAVRALAKKHLHISNQRKDFFHKTSLKLVKEFDHVAFEDLNIAGMVKNHRLAKSISDAAWGTFLKIDFAKAENAGRGREKVNPYRTSQDCCECGARMKLSLAERVFRCTSCGAVKGRDHNAAVNILGRAGPFVRAEVALPSDQRISVH